ncbi:MAG: Ig-like domain-containing protein [Alkalispirochaeta sp.]
MGSLQYTGTTDETRVWYAVDVTGGSTYRISWDDFDVTSGYADIVIDAFHGDGTTEYFTGSDYPGTDGDGYLYRDLTPPSGETKLYVVADGDFYSVSGGYRLKVTDIGGGDGGGESASLSLSTNSVGVAVGETETVTATAQDADGNSESVTASSSSSSIATASVSGSTITISGVTTGSATVTVTSASSESANIAVTVTSGETSVVEVGSWSQLGTSAIATVGGSSTYNPPQLDFDTDGNPYVGYVDETTKVSG